MLDEFDSGGAKLTQSREQRDRRAQAAHGDFVAAANFKKSGRFESEDFFNSQRIFASSGSFVFVVIQVSGGEEQHIIVVGENSGERLTHGGEKIEVQRAQRNRHEGERRR